jgi:mono/diheme cytochrome c family protein
MRITIALLFVPLLAVAAQDQDPAKLYTVHCAQCHEHDIRAASRAALSKLSPAMISTALETGSMRNVGSQLTTDERQSIAAYLGNVLLAFSTDDSSSPQERTTNK